MLTAEMRYEAELREKCESLQAKFQSTQKVCSENGTIFGFITDNAVYSYQNSRLDILKWIKFTARSDTYAIEFINEVFNPVESIERLIVEQGRKMSKICDKFEKLAVLIQGQESNAGSLIY